MRVPGDEAVGWVTLVTPAYMPTQPEIRMSGMSVRGLMGIIK